MNKSSSNYHPNINNKKITSPNKKIRPSEGHRTLLTIIAILKSDGNGNKSCRMVKRQSIYFNLRRCAIHKNSLVATGTRRQSIYSLG